MFPDTALPIFLFKSEVSMWFRFPNLDRRASNLAFTVRHCLSDRSMATPTSSARHTVYATNTNIHFLLSCAWSCTKAASETRPEAPLGDSLLDPLLDDWGCKFVPKEASESIKRFLLLLFLTDNPLDEDAAGRIWKTRKEADGVLYSIAPGADWAVQCYHYECDDETIWDKNKLEKRQ